MGARSLLRPEKKIIQVVCLAGARLLLYLPRVRFTQNHPIFSEIECITFECNKFVLVLFKIDLIHFEHLICISST